MDPLPVPDAGPTGATNAAELDAVHEQPAEVVTETENSAPLELIGVLGGSPTVNAQPDGCDDDCVLGDVGPVLLQATSMPRAVGTHSHARILVKPRMGGIS